MDPDPSLRKQAATWSLAGDKQLLNSLQDVQQKVTEKAKEANDKFGCIMSNVSNTGVSLNNVKNRFTTLTGEQFIENRVYDDDTDTATDTTKEEMKSAIKPAKKSNLSHLNAMEILQRFHEEVVIFFDSSDSESSCDDEYKRRVLLRLKNIYADRPLPHIIGSNEWKNKWHAGLIAENSDDERSITDDKENLDEYSETDEEVQVDKPVKKAVVTSVIAESSLIEEVKVKPVDVQQPEQVIPEQVEDNVKSQSDFAADLARRLSQGKPTKTVEEKDEPIEPIVKPNNKGNLKHILTDKIEQHKIVSGVLFADEPPPLPQSDDDDIFSEMHKAASTVKKQNNKNIEDLFKDDNDIFDDLPKIKENDDKAPSSKKEPISSNSSIKKEYRTQSPTLDDDIIDTYTSALKSDEDKNNKENPLNLHQENNSDKKVIVKAVEPNKKFVLSDDIFDDVEGIFSDNFLSKQKLEQPKVTKLFDDDDEDQLFADIGNKSKKVGETTKKDSENVSEHRDNDEKVTGITGDKEETKSKKVVSETSKIGSNTISKDRDHDKSITGITGNKVDTESKKVVSEASKIGPDDVSEGRNDDKTVTGVTCNREEPVINQENRPRRYVLPPIDMDLAGYESEEDYWPTDSRLPPNSRYIVHNRFLNNEKILSAARKPNNRENIRKAIFDEILPICESLDNIIIKVENKTNAINERRRNEARLAAEADRNIQDQTSTNDHTQENTDGANNEINVNPTINSMAENSNRAVNNTKENDTFLDPSVSFNEATLKDPKSEGSFMNAMVNTETKIINNLKETKIGTAYDDFTSIFKDQPPKLDIRENKRVSNINALFGDDSDDESIFFKKSNGAEEKKEDNSQIVGITQDKPPVHSVSANIPDINKNNDGDLIADLQVDFKNATPKDSADGDGILDENKEIQCTGGVSTPDADKRSIGKIISNINIDVNALLPGASPTKIRNVEQECGAISKSSSNLESYVQQSNLENSLIKSSSFEDEPDSPVLCNKKSKERAKIQVKRRPSSRKARIDAINKIMNSDKQQKDDDPTVQKLGDTAENNIVPNENTKKEQLMEEPSDVLDNVQTNENKATFSDVDDMFKLSEKSTTNVTEAQKDLDLLKPSNNDLKYVLNDSDDDIFATFAKKDNDKPNKIKLENPLSDESGDELIFKTSRNTLTRIVKPKNHGNYKNTGLSDVATMTSGGQNCGAIPKTKIIKTTNFDDDSDSPDLYNDLSKDKSKQPVKKRTSSRKSRKDTCRNSDKYLKVKPQMGEASKTLAKKCTDINANDEDKSLNTAASNSQYKKYVINFSDDDDTFKSVVKSQKTKPDSIPKELDPREQVNKGAEPEGSDEDIFATFSKKPDSKVTMKRSEGPINIKKKPEARQPASDDSEDELIFKTSHNTLTRIVKPKKDSTNQTTEPAKVTKEKTSVFDSSSDEGLFDTKPKPADDIFAKTTDKTALNKALKSNSLFGDDSNEELFGNSSKIKVSEPAPPPRNNEKVMSTASEVFDDPLSAFQNEEEQFF